MVTLEWNADDVADAYASQFRGDEQYYEPISDRPNEIYFDAGVIDQATGYPAPSPTGPARS